MMFFIPIGRKGGLAQVPWATSALLIANIAVYVLTWPAEKKHVESRLPGGDLNAAAMLLAEMATQDPASLPGNLRERIDADRRESLYPTPATDGLLRAASTPLKYRTSPEGGSWREAWDRYEEVRRRLRLRGVPDDSVFDRFGFSPGKGWWPGMFTALFLHQGFLHLFFNMLFLWIVGCGIEERWGAPLFLAIYFSGGAMADLLQQHFHPTDLTSVGASGAVAAVMGAFLIRHYKAPIRVFYFAWVFIRIETGVFLAPAWLLLLLWLAEQLFWGMLTRGSQDVRIGYWAHIGGFAYGALAGVLIRGGGWAEGREKESESTEGGLRARVDEAEALFAEGQATGARTAYESILADAPGHPDALLGAYRALEFLNDSDAVCRLAPRALWAAAQSGRSDIADALVKRWWNTLAATPFPDGDLMALAQGLEKLGHGREAVALFERLLRERPSSPHRGRALLSLGKLHKAMRRIPDARRCFEELLAPPLDLEWKAFAETELRSLSGS